MILNNMQKLFNYCNKLRDNNFRCLISFDEDKKEFLLMISFKENVNKRFCIGGQLNDYSVNKNLELADEIINSLSSR